MTEAKESTESSTPKATAEDGNDGKPKTKSRWSKKKKSSSKSSSSTTTVKKSASTFKGDTKGIEEYTFNFDPQMNRKWMMSRLAFIEYSGREYGPNAKASLKRGVKTIITPSTPKTYTKAEYTAIQGTQELDNYKMAYKNYLSADENLNFKMGKLYDCLWGQCDPALQNKKSNQINDLTLPTRYQTY